MAALAPGTDGSGAPPEQEAPGCAPSGRLGRSFLHTLFDVLLILHCSKRCCLPGGSQTARGNAAGDCSTGVPAQRASTSAPPRFWRVTADPIWVYSRERLARLCDHGQGGKKSEERFEHQLKPCGHPTTPCPALNLGPAQPAKWLARFTCSCWPRRSVARPCALPPPLRSRSCRPT